MPLSLSPVSRRSFLARALSSTAAVALAGCARTTFEAAGLTMPVLPSPAVDHDPDHLALLSDVHISSSPRMSVFGSNMTDHLRQAVAEILTPDGSTLPSHAIVNGDCAYSTGQPADYAHLLTLLAPLTAAGVPVHLGLGNHDHRARLAAAVPSAQHSPEDRRTLLVETPRADVIVLDSLDRTNSTPGELGAAQLAWLRGTLDAPARRGKPTIVMVHHNPTTAARAPGIADTHELLDVLVPRRQVKALLFGHTHFCFHRPEQGLHLVNLPATGYSFASSQPTAWTSCRLTDNAATLTLNATDVRHPRHHQTFHLPWRA